MNLNVFERMIAQSASRLGLEKLKLTPHLARHGGISTDVFEEVLDLAAAKKRGKWLHDASVRRYEKHARLLAVFNKLSASQRARAAASAEIVGRKVLNLKVLM